MTVINEKNNTQALRKAEGKIIQRNLRNLQNAYLNTMKLWQSLDLQKNSICAKLNFTRGN